MIACISLHQTLKAAMARTVPEILLTITQSALVPRRHACDDKMIPKRKSQVSIIVSLTHVCQLFEVSLRSRAEPITES